LYQSWIHIHALKKTRTLHALNRVSYEKYLIAVFEIPPLPISFHEPLGRLFELLTGLTIHVGGTGVRLTRCVERNRA
jgi:hypothetical protein